MPIYVDETVLEDGSVGETIEVLQQLSEAPLTHHPETGFYVAPGTTKAMP